MYTEFGLWGNLLLYFLNEEQAEERVETDIILNPLRFKSETFSQKSWQKVKTEVFVQNSSTRSKTGMKKLVRRPISKHFKFANFPQGTNDWLDSRPEISVGWVWELFHNASFVGEKDEELSEEEKMRCVNG